MQLILGFEAFTKTSQETPFQPQLLATDFDMAYQRDKGTYVTPIVHIDNFGFAFKKGASTSQEEFDKFTCRIIGTFLD
jgi:hypothetical protein